jgi:acyl-CoA thioester hydrolase
MTFEQRFQVGWSHLDANAHMRNTAYLDLAAGVRVTYFAAAGFSVDAFAQLQFGPVIRREELEYFRELRLQDDVRVTLLLAGSSEDASRFRLRNEFWRESGTLVARLTSLGGWLDLRARRLIAPPPDLATALHALERTSDFEACRPVDSSPHCKRAAPEQRSQLAAVRPCGGTLIGRSLQPLETSCQHQLPAV